MRKAVLSLGAMIALSACSPHPTPAPASRVVDDSGRTPATNQPIDAGTIDSVSTEDKLTVVTMTLSPLRHDLTNASAQAVKQIGIKVKSGELAVGSDTIAVGIMNGHDIVMSVKYPAKTMRNMDFSKISDAQLLEASVDTAFSSVGAADAQGWCDPWRSVAPKFCKLAQ